MKKKNKTWLEKFQDFWGKLDGEEQQGLYLILTALRGPDVAYNVGKDTLSCEIKLITTSRIRYEVFKISDQSYLGFVTCVGEDGGNRKKVAKKIFSKFPYNSALKPPRQLDHFFEHTFLAYRELQRVNPGCLDDIKEIFE